MKRAAQVTAALAVTVGLYFALCSHGLRSALDAGDSAEFKDRIDFPALARGGGYSLYQVRTMKT